MAKIAAIPQGRVHPVPAVHPDEALHAVLKVEGASKDVPQADTSHRLDLSHSSFVSAGAHAAASHNQVSGVTATPISSSSTGVQLRIGAKDPTGNRLPTRVARSVVNQTHAGDPVQLTRTPPDDEIRRAMRSHIAA